MIGFASPWILAGLAALAAPVLIHLIRRERATPLRFPSIRFIHPSRLPRDGRRNPNDLLLLLLRMLLIATLVLAVAGMEWVPPTPRGADAHSGGQQVVLLVDVSASMGAGERWQRARERAAEFLDGLPRSARVSLLAFDTSTRMVAADQAPAAIVLDDCAPGLRAGRPGQALREALRQLGANGPGRLAILSDFQASNWTQAVLPEIPASVALELLPVADGRTPNAGILSARVFTAAQDRLHIIARLRNFGDAAVDARLRLESAESDTVTLEPGRSQNVALMVAGGAERGGLLELVSEAYDGYPPDDTYALWLGAPPPVNVLTLLPLIEEPDKGIEVDFVRRALEVGQQSGRPTFRVLVVDIGEPIPLQTGTIRVLYLPGTAAYLDELQWQRLVSFVENGGLVLSTPGQGAPMQFRRFREKGLSENEYLGRPARHRDHFNPYRVARPQSASALGTIFSRDSARDLALTQIYQYVRLRPGADAEVLLAAEGGDPLLIREGIGRGTLVTAAFGFDTDWSDLPLRNSFLPILREMLEPAAPNAGGVRHLHVGEALPQSPAEEKAAVVIPDTDRPTAARIGDTPVEVNVDRAESDPASALLSDLRANLRMPAAPAAVATAEGADADKVPLWPWLVAAALLVLFVETLLASANGRAQPLPHA